MSVKYLAPFLVVGLVQLLFLGLISPHSSRTCCLGSWPQVLGTGEALPALQTDPQQLGDQQPTGDIL